MRNLWSRLTMLAQAGAVWVGLSHGAAACAFHGYIPDPTLVDILLGSDHAVLARPDPTSPRQYSVVAPLIGPVEGVTIPILVDSETRTQLTQDPAKTVLFARDGAYGPWLKLAILDQNYRSVVDTVVARRDRWRLGGDEDRYQLFAALLNDGNADVRRLALLELDRADYSLLKDTKLPEVASLKQDLARGDPDLLPIRLLLAGLSRDRGMAPLLSAGLSTAAGDDVVYLGAYATALIELMGPEAVRHIAERYLSHDALPLTTKEKIVEAFAIHSQTGARKTRREIRRSTADLLSQSPELAGAVARQFGVRSDWSMWKPLKSAISASQPTAIEDIFAINQYIAIAERAE